MTGRSLSMRSTTGAAAVERHFFRDLPAVQRDCGNETTVPKPLANGKSYDSCLTYLMPGGGSIQKVQWGDGPAAADQVTPYFDKPIVWAGG